MFKLASVARFTVIKHNVVFQQFLKIHPDLQDFSMDDPAMLPIYEACQGRFIILFHVGSLTTRPQDAPSSPWRLANLVLSFPSLDIVAAHFGGYRMWQWVPEALSSCAGEHLWLDTSSTSMFVDAATLRCLMCVQPREHYFFGTDYPLYHPCGEVERFQALSGYGDGQMDDLFGNAARLLSDYGML